MVLVLSEGGEELVLVLSEGGEELVLVLSEGGEEFVLVLSEGGEELVLRGGGGRIGTGLFYVRRQLGVKDLYWFMSEVGGTADNGYWLPCC